MKVASAVFVLLFLLPPLVFGGADERVHVDVAGGLRVVIAGETLDGCSFSYSPIDFCDERHGLLIRKMIREQKPNFFNGLFLISIPERVEYDQKSLVVVNKEAGEVYPLPIDSYSEAKGGNSPGKGLLFNDHDNKICIVGDILVYRVIKSGRFCFFFDGKGFSGYRTEYMR